MRVSSALAGFIGVGAGLAAAAVGFQSSSAVTGPPHHESAVAAVGRPLPAAPPQIRVKLAHCAPRAKLVHGACVTHVERTVVVHDQVPASALAPAPQMVSALEAEPQGDDETESPESESSESESSESETSESESSERESSEPGDDD